MRTQVSILSTLLLIFLSNDLVAGQPAKSANATYTNDIVLSNLLKRINTDAGESWISIHPNGHVALFGRHNNGFSEHRIFITFRSDNDWTTPEPVPFVTDEGSRAARFSPDGGFVVFSSDRAVPGEQKGESDWNLWQVIYKGDNNWGEPEPLLGVFKSVKNDFHASVASNTNIYFGSRRDGGKGNSDMYVAEKSGFDWSVSSLNLLNTTHSEPDPFIDPAGRYIIFARTDAEDGFGGDDLYISYRDGVHWSVPRNLGAQVNSAEYEYGAFVSHDEKILFYTTYRDGHADITYVLMDKILAE
ncbi:TolB family protein [Kordiimonas aquimaris]|uniref:TolB family protein n=1 Tax=Kordiimonas aquimaris TaxID=707591 RepID=UPI0021D3B05B|nr:hypothetical protein [Kordiimonas aquimaris]